MSEKIGPVAVLPSDGAGPSLPEATETSPETRRIIDQEVQRLIESAHAEATGLLSDHRPELQRLSQALLQAETLTAADAYTAAGLPMLPARADAPPNNTAPPLVTAQ